MAVVGGWWPAVTDYLLTIDSVLNAVNVTSVTLGIERPYDQKS